MGETLKRYDLVRSKDPSYRDMMMVRPDGAYVKYADICDLIPRDEITPQMAAEWQPIETAPKGTPSKSGAKAYSWMMLAIPCVDGEYQVLSGMRCGDEFFAAPTFYRGGAWGTRQLHLKEQQVYPTHWAHLYEPPALTAIKESKDD